MKNGKLLGYEYWFEVYLRKSTLDGVAWDFTLKSILQHVGLIRSIKVIIHIDGNLVHYYVGANKDLSGLSNNLMQVVLRPIDASKIALPQISKSERLVVLVPGGNILDLRERYELKRQKVLEWGVFTMRGTSSVLHSTASYLFRGINGHHSESRKQAFSSPGSLIAINFRENEKYDYMRHSKHLDIQKSLHILKSDPTDALFEVGTFPYLPKNAYLSLPSYDFDKHSFIVGASGSGKSKFISLFVDRLLRSPMASNYRIVVVDPHASLEQDIGDFPDTNVINFRSSSDSTELFSDANTDISAATELTGTLFESLLGKNYNGSVERLLRFSMLVLMTAQIMSLDNLKRLLTDDSFRVGVLDHVEQYAPANVISFFRNEYVTLQREHYQTAIFPIVELVDEIQVQPALSGKHGQANSLAKVIGSNRMTLFSLNKVGMGEKVIKTVSGLLIQQLFLLAQARAFNEKIILIIDEVSVVQNPTIAQILAEARKYNLFVFLSQQYFGQIDEKLQNAIFSNVTNYYVFKVSEHDARILEGNITMELPKKMIMEATRVMNKEEDLRVPILTELDPRDCVVRVSAGGKTLPAFKGTTLDFSPSTRERSARLVELSNPDRPAKYVEPDAGASANVAANKPQFSTGEGTVNLMEVLASKSSKRNKRPD
ncbi:MAG TPA: DUF87 domain-containing protein [Candidatus Saccharimonadales bacterium]